MEDVQAVILVGGLASRLRRAGVEVALSKAFMEVQGQPLLYWCLQSLQQAGIGRLVIVGQEPQLLQAAGRVLRRFAGIFAEVQYFHDLGLGAHGVPYELNYLLRGPFVFECGHSLQRPAHYRALLEAYRPGNVVFSAFRPHASNRRQPVALEGAAAHVSPAGSWALAHPIVADRQYAHLLLRLRFSIRDILAFYTAESRLRYVISDMPPEYDTPAELEAALKIYNHYLASPAIMQQ